MLSGDKKGEVLTLKIIVAKEAVSAIEYFILEEGSLGCSEESFISDSLNYRDNVTDLVSITGYWLPYGRHTKTGIINPAPPPMELEKRANQFIKQLQLHGLNPGNATVYTSFIRQEDWSKSWKAHFKPINIGRLLVTPSWIKPPQNNNLLTVFIDPEMAFGTGDHPTTKMCLEFLDAFIYPGDLVLDVGTGSGILAIASAKLGAKKVFALDNDPLAVETAIRNCKKNKVAKKITCMETACLDNLPSQVDLIVANLTTQTILENLAPITNVLKDEGVFIGSGIPHERKEEIKQAIFLLPLTLKEIREKDGWIALAATKHKI